jgi:uncharacterized protein YjbI with pentapeptide repeats
MVKDKLYKILENHKHWLHSDVYECVHMKADLHSADLRGADLRNAELCYVDLHGASLRCADLWHANLHRADLHDADLRGADLYRIDLYGANLINANLRGADLQDAILYHADLSGADLRGADLNHANLYGANLHGADLRDVDLCLADLCCANLYGADLDGANLYGANLYGTKLFGDLTEYRKGKLVTEDILGYKNCDDNIMVTFKIPRGAIIFSIDGHQCRTNKVKVIDIDGADRAYSWYHRYCHCSDYVGRRYMSYYVGDEITVYDFNCEYNSMNTEGIHFFLTKEDAKNFLESRGRRHVNRKNR